MANIIYQSTISNIGEFAVDVLMDGMLITFKEGAPVDLADYCFTHLHGELLGDLTAGQVIQLGAHCYTITAVGGVATTNFRELGHLTVHFDAKQVAELPGSIHVEGDAPRKLCVGDNIIIIENK